MGQPITAEQHNQTRRAQKAKQKAAARAKSKGRVGGSSNESILEASKKDRRRHEVRMQKRAENEARLLAEVESKGILIIRKPTWDDCDWEEYEYAERRFNMNVADVKRAAKRSATRFHWHTTDAGDFVIAKPRKAA